MRLTREFYIPKDSTRIDGPAGCCVYLYQVGGRFAGKGFGGKRAKPDWNYVFSTPEQRQKWVDEYFAGQEAHAKRVAERRQERSAARCSTPEEVWQKACSGNTIISNTDAAVCLRAVLARKFPGTKFSVTTDGSLHVSWVGGPCEYDVKAIASQYSFQGFDGSIDMRYYITRWLSRDGRMSFAHTDGTEGSRGSYSEGIGDPHSPDAVEVRGGPDFVFVRRSETLINSNL